MGDLDDDWMVGLKVWFGGTNDDGLSGGSSVGA